MADELAAEAVLNQPGRALRALDALAAAPAQRDRRIAAAIEEQQRLLPRGQGLLHPLEHPRRQTRTPRRGMALEVDSGNRGELIAAVPRRQMQRTVAAGRDVGDA